MDTVSPRALVVAAFSSISWLGLACGTSEQREAGAAESAVATSTASAAASSLATAAPPSASAAQTASASAAPSVVAAPPPLPGRTDGCREGMVRVAGDYCPALTQNCLDHHAEYDSDKGTRKTVSERCMKYEEPSRCVSKKRKPMSFCMDRWEYPNKVGELPRILTSWRSAKKLCEAQGKRLCTEQEFNFACEGPEMLPYVYGYVRDPKTCSIDRPYVMPDHSRQLPEYDECPNDPHCKAEIERVDQREKIGQRTSCVSWAGIYDLNGNVNEWVELPGKDPPDRSGLKGGWWGPVRGRCRPTVTFHKESDYGYEVGFRCCTDAAK